MVVETGRVRAMAFCVFGAAASVLFGTGAISQADAAQALSGPARVIDGDTLEIAGETVRILSIDAPETGQRCGRARCGDAATRQLARLASSGPVTCTGQRRDAYGRLLARCAAGGRDLGQAMVASGHAVVFRRYSNEYDAEERAARAARRGVWAADDFVMPWAYREARWAGATASADTRRACPIKGNISASGTRIYHPPWSRHYDRTRIDEARGERWFCTEAEALAAGWRAPRG